VTDVKSGNHVTDMKSGNHVTEDELGFQNAVVSGNRRPSDSNMASYCLVSVAGLLSSVYSC